MPLYEYRCRACGRTFEAYKRPVAEPEGETCPSCGGVSDKLDVSLFSAVGDGKRTGSKGCGGGSRRSPFS